MYPNFFFWTFVGILLAILFIAIGRRSEKFERIFLSGSLFLAGPWYIGFGIANAASPIELFPQIIGGILFAILGWLGMTRSLIYGGLGWLLHATWDFASPHFSEISYMPAWVAPACLGFDILLGIYLLQRAQGFVPIRGKTPQTN